MNPNQNDFKIILLGESSVGKSSILTRFTKDTFSELTISTVSEFLTDKEIEIKGSPMKLQIWDTAGQERYRSIINNYYNNCTVAILVYDITNRDSFEKIQSYWYNEIIDHVPNISKYKIF